MPLAQIHRKSLSRDRTMQVRQTCSLEGGLSVNAVFTLAWISTNPKNDLNNQTATEVSFIFHWIWFGDKNVRDINIMSLSSINDWRGHEQRWELHWCQASRDTSLYRWCLQCTINRTSEQTEQCLAVCNVCDVKSKPKPVLIWPLLKKKTHHDD